MFGSDGRDVVDSSTSELSDSVFASTGQPDAENNSKSIGEASLDESGQTKDKSDLDVEKDSVAKETMGFDNPVYGSGGLEDSGSIGFGSPFGTTKFGDEFGDLEHIREYAKLMEEQDRGSEDESSVEFSDTDDPLDLEEKPTLAG